MATSAARVRLPPLPTAVVVVAALSAAAAAATAAAVSPCGPAGWAAVVAAAAAAAAAGTVGWPPLATDVLGLHGASLPTVRGRGHSAVAGNLRAYVAAGTARRLVDLLCSWQAAVGDGVNYQVYFFGRRVVHLVHPADVRHVQVRVNPPRDAVTMRHFGTPISRDVLVLLDDRRHAAARRLVGPFLLGPPTTAAVLRVVNDQLGGTGCWARRLDALATTGEACDVDSLLVDVTLGVIHEVLFSEPWASAAVRRRARAALSDFFRLQYLSCVPAPAVCSPAAVAALRAAGAFFVDYVGAMEARRRAAYADGSRARSPPADLFDILLADLDAEGGVYDSRRRVAADVMIFLAGGFDSTVRWQAVCVGVVASRVCLRGEQVGGRTYSWLYPVLWRLGRAVCAGEARVSRFCEGDGRVC